MFWNVFLPKMVVRQEMYYHAYGNEYFQNVLYSDQI